MRRAPVNGQLDLLLLSAFTSGEAHGYAVITRIRERSEGRFDLLEGTVYPALHRLEEEGLLSSQWAVQAGRRRRTYALTAPGERARQQKASEWKAFSAGMGAMLGVMA